MKNPLLNSNIFVPDGEAHVWEDGRIYVYGSWDNVGIMEYCSDKYHVFSSDNMTTWVDHGVAFTTEQMERFLMDILNTDKKISQADFVLLRGNLKKLIENFPFLSGM